MSSNILQAFGSNKKAAMFRTSNCCGGTSSGADIVKHGAIAVSAMNTLAHRVFTERDVEIRRAKRRTGPRGTSFDVPRGRTRAPSHLMRLLPQFWKTTSTTWTTSRRDQF